MPVRFTYPFLLSIAGILFFILPFNPRNIGDDAATEVPYTGSNTLFFNFNDLPFNKNTTLQTEVSHSKDLFYLTLWIGGGRENRITFVLKDEDIRENVYELDNPSKRYLSFHYQAKECTYSSDDFYTGMLMIHKYDTTNKIIAASFEFMAWSNDCNELIRVANGTFDATYFLK